ncbi:MAG: peptidoglycan-binding protein, partial [Rhabdaerophilum sp.]
MRAALILAGCLLASFASAQRTALPAPMPLGAAQASVPAPPNNLAPEKAVAPEKAKPKPIAKAKPKAVPPPLPLTRVVAKNDPRPTIYPGAADAIQDAAERYRQIAQSGGWPALPQGLILKQGQSGAQVLALRQRLAIEGDLDPALAGSPDFDAGLLGAVKAFQARHGLAQTGLVGNLTLRALNVSAHERYQALNESAKRLHVRQFAFGQRYVVVNIPSASVEAIAAGQVERRHIAVVGKPDRPSP